METDDVVAAVLNGDFDDDLTDLVAAVRERTRSGLVEMCWRLPFDDVDITEENLTVGEAKLIEAATGESITRLPIAGSAKNIAAVIVSVLIQRQGMKAADAFELVDKRSVKELLGLVNEYAVTNPPKDGGEPTTPPS